MYMSDLDLDKATLTVYFAGKINQPEGVQDWRLQMRDGQPNGPYCTLGKCMYEYYGPFYTTSPNSGTKAIEHGTEFTKHDKRQMTRCDCLDLIAGADLIIGFAQTGCYGTMYELGYANALQKCVLTRIEDEECWFASSVSDYIKFPESVVLLRRDLEQVLEYHSIARALYLRIESPLEGQFIKDMWTYQPMMVLQIEAQVQVGKYRLDFAHNQTKVAIELDGYTYHGRDAAFKHDRERDRWLSAQGWTVLRFHGDEVRKNGEKNVGEVVSIIQSRQFAIEPAGAIL